MDFKQNIIGVNGDCFLCPNDYYQSFVYAHITDGEIDDIVSSQNARYMRQVVYGKIPADQSFLCRRCSFMKNSMLLKHISNKSYHE